MDSWLIILGVAPFLIGMTIQVVRNLVLKEDTNLKKRSWKWFYKITLPLHSMCIGALIGLAGYESGLPVPEIFGDKIGGAVLAYMMSGGVAVIGYDSIVKTLKRLIGTYKNDDKEE
jgi:hypothetical protein